MASRANIKAHVAAMPEKEIRKALRAAAMQHKDIEQKLRAKREREPEDPDWDDFNSSLPAYYSAIPAHTPVVQLKMLDKIMQEVVLNEDSTFHKQLEKNCSASAVLIIFQSMVCQFPPSSAEE